MINKGKVESFHNVNPVTQTGSRGLHLQSSSTIKQTAQSPSLREENMNYRNDSIMMNGYVVYDANKEGKRPGVLVVHEWWGLNDYPKMRARKLAELGYVAMAIDLYGGGETADN